MFGIAHTVVKPPAAAEIAPVRIVVLSARLAQVHVHVDQPRRHDEPRHVDAVGVVGTRQPPLDRLDPTPNDEHVARLVDRLRRIDDPPTSEQ